MKEITGKKIYENIQYYWVFKKGRSLSQLKEYLGLRYKEYQSLVKMDTVSNKLVHEYAILLKTSVSRLRMNDKSRNGRINSIHKIRANKYNLSQANNLDERTMSFVGSLTNSDKSNIPKPDITSKKWNDNEAKKLREYFENRKRYGIDDSEFNRGAIK